MAGIRILTEREFVNSEQVLSDAGFIRGLAKLEDNLVLIFDLDRFLSFDEAQQLETALVGDVTEAGRKTRQKAGEAV